MCAFALPSLPHDTDPVVGSSAGSSAGSQLGGGKSRPTSAETAKVLATGGAQQHKTVKFEGELCCQVLLWKGGGQGNAVADSDTTVQLCNCLVFGTDAVSAARVASCGGLLRSTFDVAQCGGGYVDPSSHCFGQGLVCVHAGSAHRREWR